MEMECTPKTCGLQLRGKPASQCTNRLLSSKGKAVEIKSTKNKGYGLYAAEDISEDEFVIEYTGQYIPTAQAENLLAGEYRNHAHHYIVAIDNALCIDATTMGNKARFINHSCSANCRLGKRRMGSYECLPIFAEKAINKGEEITINYNWKALKKVEVLHKVCWCGSANCRKYL